MAVEGIAILVALFCFGMACIFGRELKVRREELEERERCLRAYYLAKQELQAVERCRRRDDKDEDTDR